MPHATLPQLEAVIRNQAGQRITRCLLRRGNYVIGQARGCEIVVDEPSVSSKHARLTVVSEDEIFLEDLDSANGTFIDGKKLTEKRQVAFGSRTEIGHTCFEFERRGLPASVFSVLPDGFLREPRYHIGEIVVQGRTSTIFEARDTSLGRSVAIKVMRPESQANPANVLRFVREAQIASQLAHPGILPIYELNLNEQSQLFYTTRFVEGESLADVLDGLASGSQTGSPVHSLASLLVVLQKVCDAVAFAHSCGVVHCGLRPECVTIGEFGEVFVVNWGLAKVGAETAAGEPLAAPVRAAEAGSLPPVTAFTAPEQATEIFDDITARSDIYSLGALLFRILTLQPPIATEVETELLDHVLTGTLRPLSSFQKEPLPHCPGGRLPEPLGAIAMKAMSHAPADRHETVRKFQREIAAFQTGAMSGDSGLWKQVSGLLGKH